MERLWKLNTTNLSNLLTRMHLAPKPAQNTLNYVLEVIQGHTFCDHWKADEGLHITV